jgi:multidrug efflux pump subunit AcrB
MNFSEIFIRRPIATSLLMAALALVGIVAFPLLPVAPLPQVDFPTIQITATLSGASPETMGATVATPLERQFGQIAGVTQMSSVSSLGSTVITLQFDLNRNIDGAAARRPYRCRKSTTSPKTLSPPRFRRSRASRWSPSAVSSVRQSACRSIRPSSRHAA